MKFLISVLLALDLSLITSGDPAGRSQLDVLKESSLENQVQNGLNKTAPSPENYVAKDTCYEMVGRQGHLDYPSRGVDKTAKVLEAIAAKRNKSYSELKVPPALMRHLNKVDDGHSGSLNHREKVEIIRCPTAEELYPCTCDPTTAVINCSATGNFTRVKEIFSTTNFIDRSFTRFLVYSVGLQDPSETTLLAGTFGQVAFREVVIESTDLHGVEANAFAGSENTLQLIQMDYNPNLSFFPFEELHKFTELRELKLGYGKIQGVSPLHIIPKLETILLNANNIKYIDSFAFANLPNLMTLDLSRNSLQTIQANAFTFSSSDVVLYLDQNQISNIEDYAFSKEQPSFLELYDNRMRTLNASVFQPILDSILSKQYDTYIGADENPLCCSGIEWILQKQAYLSLVDLPAIDCYILVGLEKGYR
ncbi:oplophorus-luciferin 2-monooxygenase non-catalytic subunit-like [Palaemon carinicauda]|uniref:oplophorus-luciferin 2-monooxygenase non-catalytic subunit-like n=1 Tax=Palaemon carinicauda TaxID=392227 RepID=UPI0035B65DB1